MSACKSCGAYGGSQHLQTCGTVTGKRFVYSVRPVYASAQDRQIATREIKA